MLASLEFTQDVNRDKPLCVIQKSWVSHDIVKKKA